MATPFAKRRRLDHSTVNKPFKSPFRTPLKTNPGLNEAASPDPARLPEAEPQPVNQTIPESNNRPRSSFPKPSPATTRAVRSPAILSEEAKHRALSREIAACRQDIDVVQQATSIAQKGSNEALEALITRWRMATRLAAEEVFASARDRVNKMGGVGAWREREEERTKLWSSWESHDGPGSDDVDEYDENGEELGELEKEERKRVRREMREAMEEEWKSEQQEGEDSTMNVEVQENDTFTMDMMLRTMGIAPELIGWDRERQTWLG